MSDMDGQYMFVFIAVLGVLIPIILVVVKIIGVRSSENILGSDIKIFRPHLGTMKIIRFGFREEIQFMYCGMPNESVFTLSYGQQLLRMSPHWWTC